MQSGRLTTRPAADPHGRVAREASRYAALADELRRVVARPVLGHTRRGNAGRYQRRPGAEIPLNSARPVDARTRIPRDATGHPRPGMGTITRPTTARMTPRPQSFDHCIKILRTNSWGAPGGYCGASRHALPAIRIAPRVGALVENRVPRAGDNSAYT